MITAADESTIPELLETRTQYTRSEYVEAKQGWGHSHFEHAIDAAVKANTGKLFFFHHDPYRTDDVLRSLEENLRSSLKGNGGPELFMAREGSEIDL